MTVMGTCLCGAVRYEIEGPLEMMVHCHCSMCRKHHGTPFSTFVAGPLAGFRWIAGEKDIMHFASSAQGVRSFCRHCGSATPSIMEAAGQVGVPAGNLQGDLGIEPECHIFVGSKAPWYDITDSLPRFETVAK
ncbi:MAG: GFA family protein [Steroidobacteraceae bacterium]